LGLAETTEPHNVRPASVLKRFDWPEEVTGLIAFLASDRAWFGDSNKGSGAKTRTAEPIGSDLPGSNHHASLLLIEKLFGWVTSSGDFLRVLNGS